MIKFDLNTVSFYLIAYAIGYIFLIIGVKNLRTWIHNLSLFPTHLQKIFTGLKLKIYLLWTFIIVWLGEHTLHLRPIGQVCKALSSFLLCLILGDLIVMVCLICFGKLIKNITDFYPLIRKLVRFGFIFLGIVVAANNLGYSTKGLLATLGVGGAALAFASQSTISNLWATVSIMLDHPFKEGDWILIGTRAHGKVVSIGLRSTRLLTENDTFIIVPNSIVVNECIENKGRNSVNKTL